jgi:hypothetical protein
MVVRDGIELPTPAFSWPPYQRVVLPFSSVERNGVRTWPGGDLNTGEYPQAIASPEGAEDILLGDEAVGQHSPMSTLLCWSLFIAQGGLASTQSQLLRAAVHGACCP